MASLDDILAAARKKAASSNYQRTVKPPAGKSTWRILPGWKAGDPTFFHAFGQHYIKGPDGKVKMVIGCPDKTFDEPCEICDAVQEAARNAPNDKAREQILESRSSQRFIFNAIRVDEDPNKVLIMEVGTGLFSDIIANIEEDPDLIDPAKGRDIVITREGTGLNTRYSLATRSAEKSITVAKSVLMNLNDLTEFVTEDFEAKKKKALSALGLATGAVLSGSSAAGALASPGAMSLDDELDDELPDFDAKAAAAAELDEVEDAEVMDEVKEEVKAKAEASFGDDVSDDDIEKMLAGLD